MDPQFIELSMELGLSAEEAEVQYPVVRVIADAIIERVDSQCLVVGISGSQGSGKSTLAAQLGYLMGHAGYQTVQTSIDDFYLTRAERLELADSEHPLFATRGVPGTHDMNLLFNCVSGIINAEPVILPRFDKLLDDRSPETTAVAAGVNVLLLEGWCVGAPPIKQSWEVAPMNQLEAAEDSDGRWRQAVATALNSEAYQQVFDLIQYQVFLQIPDFAVVRDWRFRQEQHLGKQGGGGHTMDIDTLNRFISHYERITRHMLVSMPQCSNALIPVDDGHHFQSPHFTDKFS